MYCKVAVYLSLMTMLLGINLSMHASSLEQMPSEVVEHMLRLSYNQPEIPNTAIVSLLDQRRISKYFNEAILYSAVWIHIFTNFFSTLEKNTKNEAIF